MIFPRSSNFDIVCDLIVSSFKPHSFPSSLLLDAGLLGRIQDLTKGGSDKRPPKAVAPRGVRGHAPPENF